MKQPYWFTNNNKRIFMYGFQDIIVEYREYSQDTAEFVTKFSIEDTNRRFTSVISPTVKDPIGCAFISDYTIDHELYFDESLTREVWILHGHLWNGSNHLCKDHFENSRGFSPNPSRYRIILRIRRHDIKYNSLLPGLVGLFLCANGFFNSP